ncbi:MAG: glycosyltransferase family 4 protein [Proteobacteria bacterium]|nr:glycosyltransferase family 4 protein [Pseudomonadota bacterium]
MRIIYVMSDYPLLTTTFVDREVKRLREMGVGIDIVASRRPAGDVPLSDDQRRIRDTVTYLRPAPFAALVRSHLHFLFRSPGRLLGAIAYFLTRPHPGLRTRLLTVLHIGKGVYAAWLLREREFDEIHIHFAFGNAVSGMVAARLLDKTYTMSIHAGNDLFAYPVMLAEKIRGARHVVTCTGFNKTFLIDEIGADVADKITFIPHGLDLTRYRPGEPGRGRDGPVRILTVGNLAERKGIRHLVGACRALKDRGVAFHCDIVGDGEERENLATLIHELGLGDEVTLTGTLRHEEVIEYYRNATIFALPCVQASTGNMDGIPNVVAEAMAMRLAVISTEISGVPELVEHGVNGLLTQPGDEQALVDAMLRIIDDAAFRDSLGRRALETVHRVFDVDANTARLAETLWPDRRESRPASGAS